MKRKTLLLFVCSSFLLTATAQKKAKKITAFAITAPQKGQSNWSEVRLVDIGSGEELKTVYQSKQELEVLNARTGKPVMKKDAANKDLVNTERAKAESNQNVEYVRGVDGHRVMVVRNHVRRPSFVPYDQPFATKSAAMAYDKKHDRLYYTPMGIAQLRFIDLKSNKVFYFEDEPFGVLSGPHDVANQITRMVIASDGNGYALTNDAKHLIRFTTDKKPVITDLGALTDEAGNSASVHSHAGFGGDLIADNKKNIFLITANRKVFKINLDSKVATYQGAITGLPKGYTTNGAMVEEGSTVIVCSSQSTAGYFKFDLNTLQAEKVSGEGTVFNASDLANGTFVKEKKKREKREEVQTEVKEEDLATAPVQEKAISAENIQRNSISVYPNPVNSGGLVKIYLTDQPVGRYQVQFLDISGKLISSQSITVNSKLQMEEFRLPSLLTAGNYLLKVVGETSGTSSVNKLIVR